MFAAFDTDSRDRRFYIAGSSRVEKKRNLPLSHLSYSLLSPLFAYIILLCQKILKCFIAKKQDQEMRRA